MGTSVIPGIGSGRSPRCLSLCVAGTWPWCQSRCIDVRSRYLIVVPRPMPASPRRNLIAVPRPLPAAPLFVRCRYLILKPRPLPAAPRSCRRRRKQLGRCEADQSTYYRLYLYCGKLALAAMYLRRVRVACRGFVAALASVSFLLRRLRQRHKTFA
jgi:hypothetical protein